MSKNEKIPETNRIMNSIIYGYHDRKTQALKRRFPGIMGKPRRRVPLEESDE